MGVWGQTDVVIRWVDEAGEPACQLDDAGHTLHISTWMDGVAQHAVQGADLVVDESGISAWKGAEPGVYTLEALPWAWTLVVDGAEARGVDTLTLVWPSRRPLKLRGNPAPVVYPEAHPGARLAAFTRELELAQDSLDLDQLVGLGLVGGGVERAQTALRSALDSCRFLAGGSTRVLRTTFAVGRPRARAGSGVAHGARGLGVRHRVFTKTDNPRPQVLGPKTGLPRLVFSVGVGARGVVDAVGGTKGAMAQLGGHRPGGQPLSSLVLVLG